MNRSRLFEILPNRAAQRASTYPNIEGSHPWKLPSIKCPFCGMVWGETKVVYPWIDLSGVPNRTWYKGNRVCVMSPEELAIARRPVAELLPHDHPLPPGTSFGAFKGKHTAGRMEDFHFYYYPRLIARSAYENLSVRGALNLGATPVHIRPRKKEEVVDFLELHLVPRAKLAAPRIQRPGQKYCPECGFDQRDFPEPLIIRKDSIPENEKVFLLLDAPAYILCTEKFMEAVKSLGLTGIEFEEVRVA